SGVNPMLADPSQFDYHLTMGSPAIDKGVDPGSADAFSLKPTEEDVHPLQHVARLDDGTLEVGAFEIGTKQGGTGSGATPGGGAGRGAGGPTTSSGAGAGGGGGGGGSSSGEPGAKGGCGCRAAGEPSDGPLAAILVVTAWMARRRRRG